MFLTSSRIQFPFILVTRIWCSFKKDSLSLVGVFILVNFLLHTEVTQISAAAH